MNLLKGDSNWTLLIWKIEDYFAIAQIYGDDIYLDLLFTHVLMSILMR